MTTLLLLSIEYLLLTKGSGPFPSGPKCAWSTQLDKINNLHSSDTIDTQQLGARGESIWIQSDR